MCVGGPSSGKSPALDFAVRPLWEIDECLYEKYSLAKEKYDRDMDIYKTAKGSQKPPKPIKPMIESAILDDVTVESVAVHLSLTPRGLGVIRDEGSAWVASIGQYKNGRGSDRQFWLSALFGKPVRVDRKGNPDLEPIRIPCPFLSVVGNLVPEMLSELREQKGRADGFVERILFAFPDSQPRKHWSDAGLDEPRKDWAEIIGRLQEREMLVSSEGKSRPRVIPMTAGAKGLWVAWYNAHVDETNEPAYDAGIWRRRANCAISRGVWP